MGGRGSKSRITVAVGPSGGAIPAQQNVQPQPAIMPDATMAQAANNSAFSDTDTAGFHDLYNGRQYYQQQAFGIDTQLALVSYLDSKAEPGSLYSPSQNLNEAMVTGARLTAQQQFMRDSLMEGMHNLGYNINLTRYDHAPMVQKLLAQVGITRDWHNMSEQQLQTALVGQTYTENKFLSTSYNDFKNAPDRTFTSREVQIKYQARAGAQGLMPGNGPGGRLGEIVLAPNQSTRIVGVHIDQTASGIRRKGSSTGSNNGTRIVITVQI